MTDLPRAEDLRSIVVFRALMLGDLLCAVPALRALRAACPQAHIALVGLPWAQALVERLDCIDTFIAFPGHPGLRENGGLERSMQQFIAAMRARHDDLAIQLHGSGEVTNRLVADFGARRTCGFASAHAWVPAGEEALFLPWPHEGHEIERLLALTDFLGLPRRGTHLSFPVRDADRAALAHVWPGVSGAVPYVCVHPGAQLESRRWDPDRFAGVADAIAAQGRAIVLTGTAGERELVSAVRRAMRAPAVDLCGRTSLWTLGALIEGAAAIICNDTGVSHIAAALATPSVVVSSGADVDRWAPLDRARHPVVAAAIACRPCGFAACPVGHACARAVGVDDVLAAYAGLPATARSARPAGMPTA